MFLIILFSIVGLSGVRSDQGAMVHNSLFDYVQHFCFSVLMSLFLSFAFLKGILTRGHVPRDVAYSHGILFAFARFLSEPTYWQ